MRFRGLVICWLRAALYAQSAQKNSPSDWRVDLLHCGVIVETYRFTEHRRLVQIDSPAGTPLITRRVNSQEEASRPMTEKHNK